MPGAAEHVLRPVAIASASYSSRLADPDRAIALGEDAVAAAGPRSDDLEHARARCIAHAALTSALASAGELERSVSVLDELTWEAQRLGPYFMCEALNLRTATESSPGDALHTTEEAIRYARETGSPSRIAFALVILAMITSRTDADTRRARRLLEEAAVQAASVSHQYATDFALQSLAGVEAQEGDFARACQTFAVAVERAQWNGDQSSRNQGLMGLSSALAGVGLDDAALLLNAWLGPRGAELVLLRRSALVGTNALSDAFARLLERVSQEQRDRAAERAATMSASEIVAFARAAIPA
jgi:hypothetical protein